MTQQSFPLGMVAQLLGGELRGDPEKVVSGIQPVTEAGPNDLAFISNQKYVKALRTTKAAAVLVSPEVAAQGAPEGTALIVLDDPYMAFALLLQHMHKKPREVSGIHERAFVDPTATLGQDVNVHPMAYVGPGAKLGDRVDVHPGAYVGEGAEIGEDTTLGPNSVVHHGCQVGARCHIYAGTVIGSDGFGFAPDKQHGLHVKIPQAGRTVVDDDVEIGANSTIDRAALGETRIGRGTKIDNMVQIGHAAQVGGGCFLVAQSGISGTSRVGNGVTMAGQAGVAGHLTVGDGATIGAQAGVHADVAPGQRMLGTPAFDGPAARRAMAVFPRLPELKKRIKQLERRLAELEAKLDGGEA